jgi:hypothetical protein
MIRGKRRTLNDLRKGHRSYVTSAHVNKFEWTEEERAFLEPYIRNIDTEFEHTDTDADTFTVEEALETIKTKTTNPNTAKTYSTNIRSLCKLMKASTFSDVFKNNTTKQIVQALNTKYKVTTSYISIVLWMATHSSKFATILGEKTIEDFHTQYDKAVNAATARNITMRSVPMNYTEIYQNMFNKSKEYSLKSYGSMAHVIATMYSDGLYSDNNTILINPRNYFGQIKIVTSDGEIERTKNYLNITTGRIVINDYKTAGIYKSYDEILSTKTMKIIKASLELNPREYLITKPNGEIYSPNALSERIQKVMGYNVDTMRKAIESYEIHIRGSDRVHMAYVSRHSVRTQDLAYVSR